MENEKKHDTLTTTGGESVSSTNIPASGYVFFGASPFKPVSDWTAMLRENPQDPQAYYNRGNIHFASFEFDEAIADYSAALKFKGDFAEALVNRGVAYAYLEQYERGFADLAQAARIDPLCEAAHYNMGFFRANMGNFFEAIEHYNTVLRINPANENALVNRGIALTRMVRSEDAIADFSAAIQLGGNFLAEAYAGRAEANFNSVGEGDKTFEQQGERMKAAIADNTAALELKPDMEAAFFNRAIAHYYSREFAQAAEDFSSALKVNPNWDMA
jgi:tetratricopeptide (TPR) repeat protein